MEETRPQQYGRMKQGWTSSKFVATAVLVPAVPMLLLSIASLGLFYLAPVRFGEIISRLPGKSLIRTALVFAPATLFAIVVLALLYAVEQPVGVLVPARPRPGRKPVSDLLSGGDDGCWDRQRWPRSSPWDYGRFLLYLRSATIVCWRRYPVIATGNPWCRSRPGCSFL